MVETAAQRTHLGWVGGNARLAATGAQQLFLLAEQPISGDREGTDDQDADEPYQDGYKNGNHAQ
jgi:hypothetical protein